MKSSSNNERLPHRPTAPYFLYWGKADERYQGDATWHPLVYHCLDVTAVGASWWDASPVVRRIFLAAFDCPQSGQSQIRAWVLFFIALHDLGKFDLRFQLKAPDTVAAAWPRLSEGNHELSKKKIITGFDHGGAGLSWANQEYRQWIGQDDADREVWERWQPWLTAVTGHHGDFHEPRKIYPPETDDNDLIHTDQSARHAFVSVLADLLLVPEGLSLRDLPPFCSLGTQSWLAGFCAVCDWIGSNTEAFPYRNLESNITLYDYLRERVEEVQSKAWLNHFGLLAHANSYGGVSELLDKKSNESPRGVQVLVDGLSCAPGLILIEAPTGSGKTEAALAYAWRLLASNTVDSIVFALPTQASANAMLPRSVKFALKVFGDANVVLAHGKSKFNEAFQRLTETAQERNAQGKAEASVQCAVWLASSRKRVFLGQVGVCTVDQVLLSVLPVRHKFVRGFGLNKSILIVDEVHAYDAYMNGLLGEVLRRQKATGGSVILLSATLPAETRSKLFEAWGCTDTDDVSYPALWHATQGPAICLPVPENQLPGKREVEIKCLKLPGAFPDQAVLDRIITAAESGARVAVVVNLVDDAQRLARLLRSKTAIDVDLFHSRYRFMDRQEKEETVLNYYGRTAQRDCGRILVATQVVEQSLDLDFDWMLTQICPVDLLFQRLGRLHRHERVRPEGFAQPCCTVLSVEGDDYGSHKLIYGNTRVLWRTERLLATQPLANTTTIVFPAAYRDWIKLVYERDDWNDEPETIALGYDAFRAEQNRRRAEALRLTSMTVCDYRDEDTVATTLTRDGEMNLTILPLLSSNRLLDGQKLSALSERNLAETLNLNTIPAPASWEDRLRSCRLDTEGSLAGYRQLEMAIDGQGDWLAADGKLRYSKDFGLETEKIREDDPPG